MAVRSKRLSWGGPVTATAGTAIYTVPANETALVKHYTLANNGTGQATCTLRLGGNTSMFDHAKHVLAAGAFVDVETWWAIPAGTVVYLAVVGASASVGVFLYGAELEGIAD